MGIYSKIIRVLFKPHVEMFKEALHEELLNLRNNRDFEGRIFTYGDSEKLMKLLEEKRKKKELPKTLSTHNF